MSAAASWHDDNQGRLMAAVRDVRAAVEAFASKGAFQPATEHAESPAELETLSTALGLTSFERSLLVLCAGIELDSKLADLCGSRPTFSLAFAVFPDAHWSALSSSRPLRYWHLLDVRQGDTLTTSPLRIDERILQYLTCVPCIDERLLPLVKRVPAPLELPPSHRSIAEAASAAWYHNADHSLLPAVQLCGADASAKAEIAGAAAALAGLELLSVTACNLPHTPAEIDLLARLWNREAVLSGCALLIDCGDGDGCEGPAENAASMLIEAVRGPLLLSTRAPRRTGSRAAKLIEVTPPSANEQIQIWHTAFVPASGLNGGLEKLGVQFSFSPATIRSVAANLETGVETAFESLWDACRLHARPRLEALAQRIEPASTWDDLVLPEKQVGMLRQVALHVRHRAKVYQTWGFAAKSARGLGISALFAGPSGTGKTMAAEVLANDLRLDLYCIDLSQVVSKYIGETEKNLRRVFDAAESGAAILLFDEADALFGKRSEVKDSHDRYANIEVSYLLQRMEAYRGLAILTTNRKSALDHAFLRRIRFVVEFPFPDAAQRGEIWRHILPQATPVEGLSIERLARLNAAGGHIRNIAMSAAFLAADAGEPVRMSHLLSAARSEFAKLERPLTDAEVAGWV